PGKITVVGSDWTATVPLLGSHLNGPLLPPASGRYRLRVMDSDGRVLDGAVAAPPAAPRLVGTLFRVARPQASDSVLLDLAPPLRDDEVGRANQKRLQAAYRSAKTIDAHAIFFESYYGQN